MSKFDKLPLTRQGVRNLDTVGRRPEHRRLPRIETCPPHVPTGTSEWVSTQGRFMQRCRICKKLEA
jgi:hypothetical protein